MAGFLWSYFLLLLKIAPSTITNVSTKVVQMCQLNLYKLHVETEVHHIAVLDYIVLAFDAEFACQLNLLLGL